MITDEVRFQCGGGRLILPLSGNLKRLETLTGICGKQRGYLVTQQPWLR